jgi:hypothetical protein
LVEGVACGMEGKRRGYQQYAQPTKEAVCKQEQDKSGYATTAV